MNASEERPDRPCDPGCSRRVTDSVECDCSRSLPLKRGPRRHTMSPRGAAALLRACLVIDAIETDESGAEVGMSAIRSLRRALDEALPRTVRFWDWLHGSRVRIAIREGQTLRWGHRYSHDEGWSTECRTWTLERGTLKLEVYTDGRDCDGRLETHAEFTCSFEDANSGIDGHGDPMPLWGNRRASQRDYSAEAAGY